MKTSNKKTGISLIVLVITIIIMIILAAAVIITLENAGIIGIAQQAKEKQIESELKVNGEMLLGEYVIEKQSKEITLLDFFEEKKANNIIDDVTDNNDGTYTIEIDGYELTIQESTLKILDIGKVGLKPKVSNIKITIDGITEAEDKTVTKGTPLIINFDHSIEGGITTVDKILPYTTDGTETEVIFVVTGTVNKENYTKTIVISLENKYKQEIKYTYDEWTTWLSIAGINNSESYNGKDILADQYIVSKLIMSEEANKYMINSKYFILPIVVNSENGWDISEYGEYIVNKANTPIGTAGGRTYYKKNNGFALACAYYLNGAEFVLVGKNVDDVMGYCSYNTTIINTAYSTIEYGGDTWYYSVINYYWTDNKTDVATHENSKYIGKVSSREVAVKNVLDDYFKKSDENNSTKDKKYDESIYDEWTTWLYLAGIKNPRDYNEENILSDQEIMNLVMNDKDSLEYMKKSIYFILPAVCNSKIAMQEIGNLSAEIKKSIIENTAWREGIENSQYNELVLTSLVPKMTANSQNGITITVSDYYNSEAYQACDQNTSTTWATASGNYEPHWLEIDLGSAKMVTSYYILGICSWGTPYNFYLQARKDENSEWINVEGDTIHEGEITHDVKEYNIRLNNIDEYRYYRFYFPQGGWTYGSSGGHIMREFKLFGI